MMGLRVKKFFILLYMLDFFEKYDISDISEREIVHGGFPYV